MTIFNVSEISSVSIHPSIRASLPASKSEETPTASTSSGTSLRAGQRRMMAAAMANNVQEYDFVFLKGQANENVLILPKCPKFEFSFVEGVKYSGYSLSGFYYMNPEGGFPKKSAFYRESHVKAFLAGFAKKTKCAFSELKETGSNSNRFYYTGKVQKSTSPFHGTFKMIVIETDFGGLCEYEFLFMPFYGEDSAAEEYFRTVEGYLHPVLGNA